MENVETGICEEPKELKFPTINASKVIVLRTQATMYTAFGNLSAAG